MHHFRSAILIVSFVAIPWIGNTQTSATPRQRDPRAIELLTIAFTQMGGQSSGVKDFSIRGTITAEASPNAPIGTFVAKARGEDWSLETNLGSNATSFKVLRGTGSIVKNGSKTYLYPSTTAGLTLDIFPLLGRWTEFNDPGSEITLVGQSVIDGETCFQVHVRSARLAANPVQLNHHGEVDVFISSTSKILAAIRYKATAGRPMPHEVQIENHYARYDHFGVLFIPTEIRRYMAGRSTGNFHISAIDTNIAFSDADFKN